mmetsp:Transcript_10374/g.31902  ORF Transcript_10374/g.31902 Transcript_10374/m.31902 type:complete len:96 (-) Transcript_10374:35-322(-)
MSDAVSRADSPDLKLADRLRQTPAKPRSPPPPLLLDAAAARPQPAAAPSDATLEAVDIPLGDVPLSPTDISLGEPPSPVDIPLGEPPSPTDIPLY